MGASAQNKFNVGGVLLDRPFKIRRLGHFGFNLTNMDEGLRFYTDLLGFRISDVMDYSKRAKSPEQLASLGEVGGAIQWFTKNGNKLQRSGRDMPGSNWHTYLNDSDGHTNELYYGI